MIVPGTRFRVARVPISRIVVSMREPRYPQRVLAYHARLTDAQRPDDDVLVQLAPYGPPEAGLFTPLDGHHRFLASVMAGRSEVLALTNTRRAPATTTATTRRRRRCRSRLPRLLAR